MDEASRLRNAWEEKGNPPCAHDELEKEYYLGAATGDYICTRCGQSFWDGKLPKPE
jgi:hypothetical protein